MSYKMMIDTANGERSANPPTLANAEKTMYEDRTGHAIIPVKNIYAREYEECLPKGTIVLSDVVRSFGGGLSRPRTKAILESMKVTAHKTYILPPKVKTPEAFVHTLEEGNGFLHQVLRIDDLTFDFAPHNLRNSVSYVTANGEAVFIKADLDAEPEDSPLFDTIPDECAHPDCGIFFRFDNLNPFVVTSYDREEAKEALKAFFSTVKEERRPYSFGAQITPDSKQRSTVKLNPALVYAQHKIDVLEKRYK